MPTGLREASLEAEFIKILSQAQSRALGGNRLRSICPLQDPGCVSEDKLYASHQHYFKLALMRVTATRARLC